MWKLQQELEADFVLKGKQYFSGSIPVEQVCMGRCTVHGSVPSCIPFCGAPSDTLVLPKRHGTKSLFGWLDVLHWSWFYWAMPRWVISNVPFYQRGKCPIVVDAPKTQIILYPPSKFSGGCSCRVDIAADDGIWKTNQDRSLELTILPEIASCFLLGRRSKPRVDATPDPLAPCDWGPLVLKTNPNHPDQPLG